MGKGRVLLIVYRILFLLIAAWLSISSMGVIAIVPGGNIDKNVIWLTIFVFVVIVAMAAGDALLFRRLRKKEGVEEIFVFSTVTNGIFAGITFIPFLLFGLLGGGRGFSLMFRTIVPVMVEIILLAEFLSWLIIGIRSRQNGADV